jgi:hypothetical protein
VKAQKKIGKLTYLNVGTGSTREILVEAELEGISYTATKGAGAGSCENGSWSNGRVSFKTAFTGENLGGTKHVGIFMSNV